MQVLLKDVDKMSRYITDELKISSDDSDREQIKSKYPARSSFNKSV